MKLSSYLNEKFIFENVEGNTIEEVIHSVVAKVSNCDKVINSCKNIVEDAVIKREHEIPTAIGKGIAIPHARIDQYNDVSVIIAKLKNPIEDEIAALHTIDKVDLILKLFYS